MDNLQTFSPILLFSVYSVGSFFHCAEALSLIRSHLSIFAFVAIAFGVFVVKSLLIPMSRVVFSRYLVGILFCF